MRIGLLNNLRAGRSDKQVSRLLRYLSNYPEVLHVETDRAGAVPEALSDLSRQEVDLLVVNGGDGTLQHALTEILEHGVFDGRIPMIAPLRGGRTNMTGLDIGAHRDPVKSFARLIESVRNGEVEERIEPRHVLRVAYGPNDEVRNGMFFGIGLIHRAIDVFHRRLPAGSTRGVLGSTVLTAGLLGKAIVHKTDGILTPDKVQVMLDGEPLAGGEYVLLIASTVRRLFAGMKPFWGEGPGGVRLTAISPEAEAYKRAAPGILRGRPSSIVTEENGFLSRNVKRVELRMDCGFTVDGEQVAPEPGRVVSLSADHVVRFVRA